MNQSTTTKSLSVWAIASEIGVILAVPLVVFVFIGAKLDALWGTTPLCILIGMVIAGSVSVVAITRKIKRINQIT